jgi:hypothetical protein
VNVVQCNRCEVKYRLIRPPVPSTGRESPSSMRSTLSSSVTAAVFVHSSVNVDGL